MTTQEPEHLKTEAMPRPWSQADFEACLLKFPKIYRDFIVKAVNRSDKVDALVEAAKEMFAVIYQQSMKRTPEKWSEAIAALESDHG